MNLNLFGNQTSFLDWATAWLETKEPNCCNGTMVMYRSALKHLAPLYEIPIDDISAYALEQLLIQLQRQSHLSRQTLKVIKSVANGAFKLRFKASPAGQILSQGNPVQYVDLPTKATASKREPILEEQIHWIVDTPHQMQSAAMIGLFAGLRRGEVLALDPTTDFLFDENAISINKAIAFEHGVAHLKHHTKTDAGMRTVYVPDILMAHLRSILYQGHIFLPSGKGTYLCDKSWHSLWERYQRDLNIKYGYGVGLHTAKAEKLQKQKNLEWKIKRFTFHQLRHTCATMMYLAGIDAPTAKRQLGHSDIRTTLNVYTHLDEQHQKINVEGYNRYVRQYEHICELQTGA